MRYNTPDNIVVNNEVLSWTDDDAIPFFLMPNKQIVLCKPKTRHVDYLNSQFDNISSKRKFINQVNLQGRFWKNHNAFSFWNVDDNNDSKIKFVVNRLSPRKNGALIFYNNNEYKYVVEQDGYEWLKNISNKRERNGLDDTIRKKLDYWFDSDMDFVNRQYVMSDLRYGHVMTRELTQYELLAATCYQIWTDFLMNPHSKTTTFTLEDLEVYIDLKYHGRVSFKELFNYFHKMMRKKMIPISSKEHEEGDIDANTMNDFQTLMDSLDFGDSEYYIEYYDDSDEPYSCNVKTTDHYKAKDALETISSSNEFIADRLVKRNINDDITLISFRIRKKAF